MLFSRCIVHPIFYNFDYDRLYIPHSTDLRQMYLYHMFKDKVAYLFAFIAFNISK